MVAFIALFFPAVLLVLVREKIFGDKHKKEYLLIEYAIFLLLTNFATMSVAYYGFHYNSDLVDSLTRYNSFAVHYLTVSILFAVAEPTVEFIFRKNLINLQIVSSKRDFTVAKKVFIYLYAMVLFLCNAIRIADNSFWGDEAFSIQLARGTIYNMIQKTAADVHPPLYYLLLIGFNRLFGDAGWVYHAATLLTLGGILIVSVTIIRNKFGMGTSVLFMTFAVFLGNASTYNMEVRMYSMAEFFVLLSFLMLYLIATEQKNIWYILFASFSLLAAYTHYYALLSVAFFYFALIAYILGKKMWKHLPIVMAICVATLIGYFPWIDKFFSAMNRTFDYFWIEETPTWRQCFRSLFSAGKFSDYMWVVLLIIVLLFIGQKNKVMKIEKTDRLNLKLDFFNIFCIDGEVFWVLAGLLSIIGTIATGMIISSVLRPVFVIRYMFPVASVAWLILAVLCSKMKFRRIWILVLVTVVLYVGIPAFDYKYQFERMRNQSMEIALERTAEIEKNAKLITNIYHLDWTIFDYYYPLNSHTYREEVPSATEWNAEDIWLFWDSKISDDTLRELFENEVDLQMVYEGYVGERYYVYIYKETK